jgi:hypothetical protein
MLEVLIYLLYGYGMFKLGKLVQQIETRIMIHKTLKAHNINLDDLVNAATDEELEENNIVLVKTEVVDDTILLYNLTTNEFLGQANTIEEAAEVFCERKKNSTAAVKHNNDELFFVDGKISKTI